jgi:myo-inositol 2-dehydrogenase/D-chiro-inositol 1-dehydrogenase
VRGFAVAGFGAWGQFHAGAVAAVPGAELRAIVSFSDDGVARARTQYPSVLCTTDFDSVIAREDIDAVCIVTPNATHEALAVAALRAGKHVLLEKPMAVDAAACARISAAAQAAGRTLNIVHELRLSRLFGDIRRWIDEGRLGAPRCLHFNLFRRPFRSGRAEWRYQPALVGTWLLEELVHYVDLAVWYFDAIGAPVSVTAAGNSRRGLTALYDNFTMRLDWPDGIYAVLSQCLGGFEHHMHMEVVGTAGVARARWSAAMDRDEAPVASLQLLDGLRGDERFDVGAPFDLPLGAASGEVDYLQDLIAAAVAGMDTGSPVVSGADGARAVALCEAAHRAACSGAAVALDPGGLVSTKHRKPRAAPC